MKGWRVWGLGALIALGAARAASAASASEMQQLAQSEGCFSCHAIDHKKVGPSYRAVAQRYAHNPHAAAILQDAILNGHQGSWGVIPMPAYAPDGYLNPHQALDLARWILSLKPAS
ncbi:c-type cytochrome [Thiomonas intermedia]|uniref:c-type cytochrome n=1 Tax=Thiomonas intermedia TaxID=926 RepID=UPI001FEC25F5|nr:c-type cytochrome [Thiomonas intermedia]